VNQTHTAVNKSQTITTQSIHLYHDLFAITMFTGKAGIIQA